MDDFVATMPREVETPVDPATLEPKLVRVLVVPDPEDSAQQHVVIKPDPFVVLEGQAICWRGDHAFTLRFIDETPVESFVELRAEPGHDSFVACARVRWDAARVRFYKYSVAVMDDHGLVHLLDPDGVVEPDPRRRTTG